MSKAMRQWWQRIQPGWRVLRGRERGQSLVLVTFAFIGILALVGLAIDLGWVYVERVRVAQAADAAALAGASELPLEGAAHIRAQTYLRENGYDHTLTGSVCVVIDGVHQSGPAEDAAPTTIWIDTSYSRDTSVPPSMQADTANRIRVTVRQEVFMTFMQFVGFDHFPVQATAEAENISNIDTVLVYDKSGSMEYDTLCYGCWERSSDPYPDGTIHPLRWSTHTIASADHCVENCGAGGLLGRDNYHDYPGNPANYEVNNCNYHRKGYSRYYTIIEAEEYSSVSVDYHDWGYTPYYTFWVMQFNVYNAYHNRCVDAMGRKERPDTREPGSPRYPCPDSGAYLSHHPFVPYTVQGGLGVPCRWSDLNSGEECRSGVTGGPFPAPRADYEFIAPVSGNYYVWIRGQGGNSGGNTHIFWGMDSGSTYIYGQENRFDRGAYYDGARDYSWSWHRLSRYESSGGTYSIYLAQGRHTLHLWAGGAGFDVDRIVVTTHNTSDLPSTIRNAPPNNGRTGWACSPCDPRFAGRPGGHVWTAEEQYYRPDCNVGGNPDQRKDAIYDDEQPIRSALEAARHFVGLLDPKFDQVGYVSYSSSASIESELQCLRDLGPPRLDDPACDPEYYNPGGDPPWDEDCGCFSNVITGTVLLELDRTTASGSTNIAYGMHRGIDVLSTVSPHFGRPGAAHIMVLMTDGEANMCSGCDGACDDEDLWPDGGADKDCVVYYARKARDNAIVIYTISLGWSADRELMEYVAELTGGYHRWAPTSDKLNEIFDELYERIFLRLIH